ncbi:hypothetical protein D3C85_1478310 [compost metagenome]
MVGLESDRRPCLAISANIFSAGSIFVSSPPLAMAAANTPLAAWAAVLTSPMATLYLPFFRSFQLFGASASLTSCLLMMNAMEPV